jgi:hypothetical protein
VVPKRLYGIGKNKNRYPLILTDNRSAELRILGKGFPKTD